MYQDIDVRIKEIFPKGASFTRNIFEEEWKKVIESDKEKYGFLSIAGNRWNKEEEN